MGSQRSRLLGIWVLTETIGGDAGPSPIADKSRSKRSTVLTNHMLFRGSLSKVLVEGVGKERRQDFGDQAGKYGSPSFSDNKGENKTSKASNMYQNEAADPCNLSSSIYYGGQENYSPRTRTTESHQQHTYKKDGGEDDANGNNANSASRGNWWQGSLYY